MTPQPGEEIRPADITETTCAVPTKEISPSNVEHSTRSADIAGFDADELGSFAEEAETLLRHSRAQ
jgi:hypothetical protein